MKFSLSFRDPLGFFCFGVAAFAGVSTAYAESVGVSLKLSESLSLVPDQAQAVEQLAAVTRRGGQTELDTRLSAPVWSSTRRLDDVSGTAYPQLTAKLTQKLESGVSFVAEGYVGQERGLSSGDEENRAELREAYVSLKQGPTLLRLGSQIVSWGRADVINPTDNVSAQDYTLLVDSDAAQKLGVPSANLIWRLGEVSVQTIWQPAFRASTIPLPQQDGIRYVDRKPEDSPDTGGMRIDSSGDRLSWSMSYFQGPSKRPNLAISPAQLAQGIVELNHPKARIYGVDFESLSGAWVLRGEGAYHDFDGSGSDRLASRESFAFAVLGVERDFGDVSAFLQGIFRRTHDFFDPDQAPADLRALAVANATVNEEAQRSLAGIGSGLSYNTGDLRWSASVDIAWFPELDDVIARPRLRYQLDDKTSVWAGADLIAGAADGPLGRLRDNAGVFVGLSRNALTSW